MITGFLLGCCFVIWHYVSNLPHYMTCNRLRLQFWILFASVGIITAFVKVLDLWVFSFVVMLYGVTQKNSFVCIEPVEPVEPEFGEVHSETSVAVPV